MAKVELLGVNASLCVAKIPDYRLARYRALMNKNRGKNSEKSAPKKKSIKIPTNCRRLAARYYLQRSIKSILLHPGDLPLFPYSVPISHFKLFLRQKPNTVNKASKLM